MGQYKTTREKHHDRLVIINIIIIISIISISVSVAFLNAWEDTQFAKASNSLQLILAKPHSHSYYYAIVDRSIKTPLIAFINTSFSISNINNNYSNGLALDPYGSQNDEEPKQKKKQPPPLIPRFPLPLAVASFSDKQKGGKNKRATTILRLFVINIITITIALIKHCCSFSSSVYLS